MFQSSYNFPISNRQQIHPIGEGSFLSPNECLVYLENKRPFVDTDGTTHIAQVIRSYIKNDIYWYDLLLHTDADGDKINMRTPVTVTGDRVVSERSYHDILSRKIYHFASLAKFNDIDKIENISFTRQNNALFNEPIVNNSADVIYPNYPGTIEFPIEATRFVIKKNLNNPLEITSRTALGSGIYGRYVENTSEITTLLTDPNQIIYEIQCPDAYVIQDKEHGESITLASLNTNRYLDRIIEIVRGLQSPNVELALLVIEENYKPSILTLWNIMLYRTQDMITQQDLNQILAEYVIRYLYDNSLTDSINGDIIQELPINNILSSLGYNGLIASDSYNNKWDRGCVCYDYNQAYIIRGGLARY